MKVYEATRHDGEPMVVVNDYSGANIRAWKLVNANRRGDTLDWAASPSVAALSVLIDHFLEHRADPAARKGVCQQDYEQAIYRARTAADHMGKALAAQFLYDGWKVTSNGIDELIIEAGARIQQDGASALVESFS